MLILANYFWFLNITFSSKNSHQSGLNQPTDMFDHSTESLKWGEKDRTWVGGLRRLWRPEKWRNILQPNSVATVVVGKSNVFIKLLWILFGNSLIFTLPILTSITYLAISESPVVLMYSKSSGGFSMYILHFEFFKKDFRIFYKL